MPRAVPHDAKCPAGISPKQDCLSMAYAPSASACRAAATDTALMYAFVDSARRKLWYHTTMNELDAYLNELAHGERYHVDAVIKSSPIETTQLVSAIGYDGSLGQQCIRKIIASGHGVGSAYELIRQAQRSGYRFKHIPAVYEVERYDDETVVVMERVQGLSLDKHLEANHLSWEQTTALFMQLCDALIELHEGFAQPIIHRDLKPSNIMISKMGVPVLIDFGISREYKPGSDEDTNHFGTRAYAPPEQFGYAQTTVRSDVYALGMVIAYCLLGRTPTQADREAGFSNLPASDLVRNVIAKATAFSPDDRFASVSEFKTALDAACRNGGNESAKVLPSQPDGDRRVSYWVVANDGSAASPAHSFKPGIFRLAGRSAVADSDSTALKPRPVWLSRLGFVWNVLIIGLAAYFTVRSLMGLTLAGTQGNSYLFDFLVYVFVLPMFAIAIGWILLDKYPLKRRFKILRNIRFVPNLILTAIAYIAFLILVIFVPLSLGLE